jgi:hypothetical protein
MKVLHKEHTRFKIFSLICTSLLLWHSHAHSFIIMAGGGGLAGLWYMIVLPPYAGYKVYQEIQAALAREYWGETIKILLKYGANPTMQNIYGSSYATMTLEKEWEIFRQTNMLSSVLKYADKPLMETLQTALAQNNLPLIKDILTLGKQGYFKGLWGAPKNMLDTIIADIKKSAEKGTDSVYSHQEEYTGSDDNFLSFHRQTLEEMRAVRKDAESVYEHSLDMVIPALLQTQFGEAILDSIIAKARESFQQGNPLTPEQQQTFDEIIKQLVRFNVPIKTQNILDVVFMHDQDALRLFTDLRNISLKDIDAPNQSLLGYALSGKILPDVSFIALLLEKGVNPTYTKDGKTAVQIVEDRLNQLMTGGLKSPLQRPRSKSSRIPAPPVNMQLLQERAQEKDKLELLYNYLTGSKKDA